MRRLFVILLSLFFLCARGVSQQSPTSVSIQRDPAAVAAIQNAVALMGGSSVAGIQDCVAQASVQPTPDAHSSPYTVTYKIAGSGFRVESLRDGVATTTASDGTRYSRQVGSADVERLPIHLLYGEFPRHLVAWVLYRELQSPNYSLRYLGNGIVNGQQVVRVGARLESDSDAAPLTAQVWSFDAVTGLPLRVDWSMALPQDANQTINEAAEFSNYQPTSGVLVPTQITDYALGIKIDVTTITSVAFNSGISPTQFQLGGVQ